MKLALQLSCYNGSRYLPFLFASLRTQTCREWKLYVLDNASTPEEAAAIRRATAKSGLPLEFRRLEKNVGFAGAHNALFAMHDAAYVQLLNDDAFLEPDFLERLLAFLAANPEHAAVSGKILRWDFEKRDQADGGRTRIIDSLGLRVAWTGAVRDIGAGRPDSSAAQPTIPQDVFGVSGCLPMYRRSSIARVSPDGNLFDPAYVSYKEDIDLAHRLQAAGYRAATIGSATAYHRRSMGRGIRSAPRPEARYQSYRNHLWMQIAHAEWPELLSGQSGVLPYETCKTLAWLVCRPDFVVRAAAETRRAWPQLMRKRVCVRALRAARPVFPARDAVEADIAVVMVSHNDLNETCLSSLETARKTTPLKVGVVIVDNGSTAYRANEVVDRHLSGAVCLLRGGDYGFGRSCNRGAREINARYYFFLNPDTRLIDPDIFDTLHAYMEAHAETGLAAPKILYFDGRLQETCRRYPAWYMPFVQRSFLKQTRFGRAYTERFQMADYDHAKERSVDWVQGSAMCIRADVWKAMGGFDDRYFMYFEDIDLCRRIRLAGHDIAYLPSTRLQHAYGKESAKLPGLFNNLARNPMARAHLASWMKYLLKWRWRKTPSTKP